MIASVATLSLLVGGALIITVLSPIVLLLLLVKDWKRGEQW